MSRYHPYIVSIVMIAATMYRSDHYGYSVPPYSLAIIVPAIMSLVFARWDALFLTVLIYMPWHISTYWGVTLMLPLEAPLNYIVLAWGCIYSLFMSYELTKTIRGHYANHSKFTACG